jgi:hypothetical protein
MGAGFDSCELDHNSSRDIIVTTHGIIGGFRRCVLESIRVTMTVLPSDERSGTAGVDQSGSGSSVKDWMVGMTFATLAGVATAGWFYLIAEALWASIGWLLS